MNHLGDTNKMVSDTPRTDAGKKIVLGGVGGDWEVVHIAFSRQLERELNESNQRIKRMEEQLMDSKNKHAVLVADVVLNEDRAERIKRLEEENDAMRADLLLWQEQEVKP